MRACQKDGLLRLERDRQGGLRVFASAAVKPSNVPHGWSTLGGAGDCPEARRERPSVAEAACRLRRHVEEEPDDTRGNVAPAVEPRPRRAPRKTATAPSAPAES